MTTLRTRTPLVQSDVSNLNLSRIKPTLTNQTLNRRFSHRHIRLRPNNQRLSVNALTRKKVMQRRFSHPKTTRSRRYRSLLTENGNDGFNIIIHLGDLNEWIPTAPSTPSAATTTGCHVAICSSENTPEATSALAPATTNV
jgi:hypothetical protein